VRAFEVPGLTDNVAELFSRESKDEEGIQFVIS